MIISKISTLRGRFMIPQMMRKLYLVTTFNLCFERKAILGLPARKIRRKLRRKIVVLSLIIRKRKPKIHRKDIGLTNRINFTIGSWKFIIDILSSNIFAEPTKSSKVWRTSYELVRHSSAEVTTKRCKKNTIIFIRFCWSWECSSTIRRILICLRCS